MDVKPTASARALAAAVMRGSIPLEQPSEAAYAIAQQRNPDLNALEIAGRQHIADQIKDLQARQQQGQELPLAGVPIAVKDNIHCYGLRTTCGSRMLQNYSAIFDATAVARIKAAGAIVLAKANCDEFAMGSSNETSIHGAVKNPWNHDCVSGGSSGGSAAAVAAGMVPAALGSDTGGSIRQPASFCGVVGLKPTYGRVSRYGLVAFASSLDQIGPLTRSVADAALLLDVMSGHDVRDATSLRHQATQLRSLACLQKDEAGLQGVRIGILSEVDIASLEPAVADAFNDTVRDLREAGAEFHEVSLPGLEAAIATYYILATAEASANLARYDGVRYGLRAPSSVGDSDQKPREKSLEQIYLQTRSEGFGAEVKRRILLGTFVLSAGYYDAYYGQAMKVRAQLQRDFKQLFQHVDVILTPTAPTTAWRLGEKIDNPMEMYLSDVFTVSANIAGIPAISVPYNVSSQSQPVPKQVMPIGIQLMADHLREDHLVRVGRAFEILRDRRLMQRGT